MITPAVPDYLPARMLNEFVYCPRLFFYEWVEGLFAENKEVVEGALRHKTLDSKEDELAPAEILAADGEVIHSRSVSLSSETHRLIAKMDLVEADGDLVTPVDYKRGRPSVDKVSGAITAWDADRVQLCVQALVLRDNGYRCDEAIIYHVATKQRVRIPIDDSLIQFTLQSLAEARRVAQSGEIPLPLVDSPKCPRCSLVGICLPDETNVCGRLTSQFIAEKQRFLFDVGITNTAAILSDDSPTSGELRRLVPARDDLRPLYLNSQGLYVGKSGNVLRVKDRDGKSHEVRINEICQLNLFGNIQLTTQAIQTLCEAEVPISYFSQGGWFYGITQGLGAKNIELRREQFRLADSPNSCLRLARAIVAGKIRNQRTMIQRNHIEPPAYPIALLKEFQCDAEHADSIQQLLGIEGNAARIYFENFAGMIKQSGDNDPLVAVAPNIDSDSRNPFRFDFKHRNRRPPRDAVNALLSLAYSVLAKDLTIITQTVGLDPYLGFYHQPRFGRASLALDLMEPFRPLIADSAVLSAINTRMITSDDFIRTGQAVSLTASGRKAFFRAYEQRMDTLVTHPLFGYRVNYRRMLEIQTRLLARTLTGELAVYPVFTTR